MTGGWLADVLLADVLLGHDLGEEKGVRSGFKVAETKLRIDRWMRLPERTVARRRTLRST